MPIPITKIAKEAQSAFEIAVRDILADLHRWFGCTFSVFDTRNGSDNTFARKDWPTSLIDVYASGFPEIVLEEDSVVLLAIPLNHIAEFQIVAVAPFATGRYEQTQNPTRLCELIGIEPRELETWFQKQTAWKPNDLMRFAAGYQTTRSCQVRAHELERNLEEVTDRLNCSYEEMSLMHRLTQNLKLTSTDEELGQQAIDWVLEYLPASGCAFQMMPVQDAEAATYEARKGPRLLSSGICPFSQQQFLALIEKLDLASECAPITLRESDLRNLDVDLDGVRQIVIAAVNDGRNHIGNLALVNHIQNRSFGTRETNLMSSVAAILGTHCGNFELYREHAEFLASVVRALTSAIDAKDPYTCGHSDRVARISVRLARELNCDEEDLHTIYMAGLLHDIGKIGINDAVLRKPGALTDEEYAHIKEHPQLGFNILADIRLLQHVLPIVLHHHEQWDGRGYPQKLKEAETPKLARIAAVADAFDAMTSNRPYRPGMPLEKVERILQEGAGKQWDPTVVAAYFSAREDILEICKNERENLSLNVKAWLK